MQRSGDIEAKINIRLWKIGWNWIYVFLSLPIIVISIFVFIAELGGIRIAAFFTLITGFVLPSIPIIASIYVKKNIDQVLENSLSSLANQAPEMPQLEGENTEYFTLISKTGDSLPGLPPSKRVISTLVVGESMLLLHDSAEIDLKSRRWTLIDSTTEFYYDQVSSVDYKPYKNDEGGEFWISISNGQSQSWQTTTDANDALSVVQDRIRVYKSQSTRA